MKLAITGEFRRGKDTVAGIVERGVLDRNITKIAFGDAVKEELATVVFNTLQPDDLMVVKDGQRFAKPGAYQTWADKMRRERALNGTGWQWWGEFMRQYSGLDYWISHIKFQYRYQEAERAGDHIIVTDMRHKNEAEWLRERGFFLIRVEGPCRGIESRDPQHPSEIDVRNIDVHAVIDNSGTMNDLTRAVQALVEVEINDFFSGRR